MRDRVTLSYAERQEKTALRFQMKGNTLRCYRE